MADSKRLLSATEAAALMGVGVRKFRSLVANGRFPLPVAIDDDEPDKRRRMHRWLIEDVNAWLHLSGRRHRKKKKSAAPNTRQSGAK